MSWINVGENEQGRERRAVSWQETKMVEGRFKALPYGKGQSQNPSNDLTRTGFWFEIQHL